MPGPMRLIRFLRIVVVLSRHTLNRRVLSPRLRTLRLLSYLNPASFRHKHQRGEAIRLTLESLGPIFVKFGQALSLRSDMIPPDIINELEKLQDSVPAFPGEQAQAIIEKSLKKPIHEIFSDFDIMPLASASVAQVHTATLKENGDSVIIKVVRPGIKKTIEQDVQLMYTAARWVQRLWKSSDRLHLTDLVKEFDSIIFDELDLMKEAANASQLKRNFADDNSMYVPKIYWRYTHTKVMVQERLFGVNIDEIETMKQHGTDLKKLAENGVGIFFTQVLRDSFFHADMHPGNLFVDIKDPANPIYMGVDFGIMGSLSPSDRRYIAENLMAFFKRDYLRVALLHIDSGWVPADTRVDQFEAAIRAVCEPIFDRPLNEISFGMLMLSLFQTARRFHMEVQPQLMLLQKTLMNIESLGRKLYPELDLWQTAKPHLERFARQSRSPLPLLKTMWQDLPFASEQIIQLPQLAFDALKTINNPEKKTPAAVYKKPNINAYLGISYILAAAGAFFLHLPLLTVVAALGVLHLILGAFR